MTKRRFELMPLSFMGRLIILDQIHKCLIVSQGNLSFWDRPKDLFIMIAEKLISSFKRIMLSAEFETFNKVNNSKAYTFVGFTLVTTYKKSP